MVDYVLINDCETSVNLINDLKPNFYIKGNDYKIYKNDKTGNIIKEIKELAPNIVIMLHIYQPQNINIEQIWTI